MHDQDLHDQMRAEAARDSWVDVLLGWAVETVGCLLLVAVVVLFSYGVLV